MEGYTSFLWMLLSAVPLAVLPEEAALRAVGFLGFALGLFTVWRVLDFPGPDGEPRRRPLAAVCAVAPVFVVNTADGMETPLAMALLLESARAFRQEPARRSGALLGALSAAAVLTRPECLPLLLVWPVWMAGLRRPGTGRWLQGFVPAAALPVAAHFAWRLAVYGQPWPNTFYAKATGAFGLRIEQGLADLGALLWAGSGAGPPLWLWIVLGLALLGLRALRGGAIATRVWLAALWTPVAFRVAFEVKVDTCGTDRQFRITVDMCLLLPDSQSL